MGVQIIDDWYDIKDDQHLGLITFVTEVSALKPDPKTLKVIATTEADNYFRQAQRYGTSLPAWRGMGYFFQLMKESQRKFPGLMGGKRERLLNYGQQLLK